MSPPKFSYTTYLADRERHMTEVSPNFVSAHSIYWRNQVPLTKVSSAAKNHTTSARESDLAQPKKKPQEEGGRGLTSMGVAKGALNHQASSRENELAQPKPRRDPDNEPMPWQSGQGYKGPLKSKKKVEPNTTKHDCVSEDLRKEREHPGFRATPMPRKKGEKEPKKKKGKNDKSGRSTATEGGRAGEGDTSEDEASQEEHGEQDDDDDDDDGKEESGESEDSSSEETADDNANKAPSKSRNLNKKIDDLAIAAISAKNVPKEADFDQIKGEKVISDTEDLGNPETFFDKDDNFRHSLKDDEFIESKVADETKQKVNVTQEFEDNYDSDEKEK